MIKCSKCGHSSGVHSEYFAFKAKWSKHTDNNSSVVWTCYGCANASVIKQIQTLRKEGKIK